MKGLENHEQLVCINHDCVHKSEVDPRPWRTAEKHRIIWKYLTSLTFDANDHRFIGWL